MKKPDPAFPPFEVVPDDDGGWIVRRSGSTEVLFHALTKQDAMNHACSLAEPQRASARLRQKEASEVLDLEKGAGPSGWKPLNRSRSKADTSEGTS